MKFLPASRGRSSFTARRAPGRDPHRSSDATRDALTLLPLVGFAVLSGFGLLGVACGAGGDTGNPIVGEGPDEGVGPMIGGGGSNGGTPLLPGENCNGADCELAGGPDGVTPPGCGNGMLSDDEACDDGNTAGGDGCAANCLATEPGFSCAAPGAACVRIARCGDGLVAPTEQCDDANLALGDGCSDRCRVELGKKCEGEPSVCTDAICGNGIQEGAEACDDGNTTPFDGCSGICLKEPNCSGLSCVSECGDGLLINEDCDDGNLVDGDGCSSTCVRETGFRCEAEAACEIVGGGCALRAPAIFRDFAETHPDFGEDKACTALAVGAVAPELDANRRPTLSAQNPALACMSTPANFAQWYTSDPTNVTNVTQVGEIVLFDNGEGGYVNRFGALGEQFQGVQQGTDRGFSPTLAACGQVCQNEANNQFQCDNQCRPISDQAQQLTNGQLIQLTNQLNQLENANPPDPVAIADVEAEIEAVQAEIADIQAQAAACLATCETNRTNDAAACTATCKPCFTDPASFCSEGVPLGFDGNPLFFPVDGITGATYSPAEARIPDQYGYNGFPFERALFPGQASYNHNFYFTTEVQYWFKYDATTLATLTFLGDDDVWVFINGRLAVDLGGIHVPSRGSVTIDAAAGTVNATMRDLRGFPNEALMAPAINRPGNVEQFGLQPGNVYLISVFNAERKRDGSSFQLTLSGFEATPSECTAICGDGVLSFGEECDDGVNDGGYGECGVVDAAGNKSCRLGPFCGDGIRQADFGEECDIGPVGDAECRGCRILDIPR